MGTPSTVISIPFGVGLDTKTDSKQVPPGKLLALQNAVFTSRGRLKKRNGYNALGANILGGGSISVGHGLFTFGSELLLTDTRYAYSYSYVLQGGATQWERKGALSSISTASTAVVRSQYQQTTQDGATHAAGFQVYAWEDSSGGVRYSVVDTVTGQFIINNALVSSSAVAPKVVVEYSNAALGYVVILYARTSDNTLVGRQVTAADATTLGSELTYSSVGGLATSHVYDAATDGSGTTWVAYANSTATITVATRNSAGTTASLALAGDAATAIAIGAPDSGSPVRVLVAYYTGSAVKYRSAQANLGASNTAQSVETISGVTSLCVPTATGYQTSAQILYTVSATTTYNTHTKLATVTNYTSNATAVFLRSVGLASKAWTYSSVNYVMVAFQSSQQSTYFAVDLSGNVVARLLSTVGGGLPARWLLPEVTVGSSSSLFRVALLTKDLLTSIGGTVFTQTGVQSLALNFYDSTLSFSSAEIANGAHVSGASLALYDGATVTEHGFHVYPEGLAGTAVPLGGAIGTSSDASYDYAQCFEWMDAQGQVHRSAPSTPLGLDFPANLVFAATTTSGSPNLTLTGGSPTTPIFSGMRVVSDSGSRITPGTILGGQYGANMSANALTSGATTITAAYQLQVSGTTIEGSAAISIPSVAYFTQFGTFTSGSTTITMASVQGLVVGMNVSSVVSGINASSKIATISGNTITIDIAATATSPGYAPLSFTVNAFTFTSTAASTSITVSAAIATLASNFVGATITGTNIPGSTTIASASGTTIVLSGAASGSATSNDGTFYLDGTSNLFVGQAVSGTGVSGTIVSVTRGTSAGAIAISEAAEFGTSGAHTLTVANIGTAIMALPTLRVTAKTGVSLVLYRTVGNGVTFYRQSSPTSPTANDATADAVTVYDTTADSVIDGNPQLYTTGAVLENAPCPPTQSLTEYRSRLVAINQEDGSVWYSKQVVPGQPVEFSASLTLNVESKGGRPKCSAVMDDKLVIFKDTSAYVMAGEGPADTGANNDFTTPQSVATDTGCNNPHSIVLMPMGLMYQSAKGIYLLDRSLQVRYIGEPVEAYNSATVTSAVLVKSVNQVRFTLSSGIALVYDYVQDQWGTFTSVAAVQALNWSGTYTYLRSDGIARVESASLFTDAGAFVPLLATTAWLTGAQLQGFQRVRRVMVLGDYASAHTLQVTVAYDYNSTVAQTSTFAVTTAPTDPYQYRVDFARRRCEAIQLTIQDSQSSNYGEGMSLSALAFEIVPQQGLNRVAPTRET